MALRVVLMVVCLGLIAFAVTQLIVPALLNQPLFRLFRPESRFERAKRLKAEATERVQATKLEREALQLGAEEKRIRDAAFKDLTKAP